MPISGTFLQENYQPIDISTDQSSTRPLIQAENQLHLAKSQSHRLTKIDLHEKIKRIRKENEEIGQQAKKSSQTHERIIQSVNSASKQAEEDLQKVGSIRRCQNNLAQKMSFLEKDFGEFHIRASIVEGDQLTSSIEIEEHRKQIESVHEDMQSFFPRLEKVSSDTSQIQFNQKELKKELTEFDVRAEETQIEQDYLGNQMMNLFFYRLSSTYEKIVNDVSTGVKTTNNALQGCWQQIKSQSSDIASHLWQNMNNLGSNVTSRALHVISSQLFAEAKEHAKVYCNIAWTYIKEEVHPITWIAIGIIASYLASLAIKTFPLTTLMVGGITFIVVRNIVMPTIELINS